MREQRTEATLNSYETYLNSWSASARTVGARLSLIRSLIERWGLDGFTRANVERFLATDDKGEPRAKWTQATYYNHLSDFCAFLVAAELLDESPMGEVRKAKPSKRRPNPLTADEVARLRDTLDGQVLDWVQIALLSGLRAFEIAKLRGQDFSDEGLTVIGKGDKEAVLPCHPELTEMRDRYPAHGYWFPALDEPHIRGQRISLIVSRAFSKQGIDGSIHRCRHTFATDLLRKGVNIRVVQRLMRHDSLETTAGYLAVLGVEENEAILLLTA